MKALVVGGFWGTSHWILDSVGRGVAWLFHPWVSPHDDEVYAMLGGATTCAIFGAWVGFMTSAQSRGLSPIAGSVLGGMVGACTGVFCGAIVQMIDDYIDALVNSINSRPVTGAHDEYDRVLINHFANTTGRSRPHR
jgi:hypothetical protein